MRKIFNFLQLVKNDFEDMGMYSMSKKCAGSTNGHVRHSTTQTDTHLLKYLYLA